MELSKKILIFIEGLTDGLYLNHALQLEAVLEKLKIKCYTADFEDSRISGAILKEDPDDKFIIYVAKQHHPNRRRFTIAHELGHYISYVNDSYSKNGFLENKGFEDYSILYRADGKSSEAEMEANEIAAEMLMPRVKVVELLEKNSTIELMAQKFFVSEIAMTIRLQKLYQDLIIT
jgi:Zn-dependent peptidase ImmA (M78 family)